MIGVGCRGSAKNKMKVMARYSDSEMEEAEGTAKALAEHNRGEYFVFLIVGKNYRILKRVKKSLHIAIPTLRHPFRFPSYRVGVR